MAEVLAVVSIILGLMVAWPCLVIWFSLAFPRPVAEARARLELRPGSSVALGAVVALVAGGFAAVLLRQPSGLVKLAGWAILVLLLVGATVGGAGLVQLIGERVGRVSAPASPLMGVVRAAVLTEFAALFPVLGWFLFAPAALLAGLGAGLAGALASQSRPRPVAYVPVPPPAAPLSADEDFEPAAASGAASRVV